MTSVEGRRGEELSKETVGSTRRLAGDREGMFRRGGQGRRGRQESKVKSTSEGLEPKLHPAHAIPATLL
jgi:hypothetical protein